MKLNRQEASNILKMLHSQDEDNSHIAFQAIEAHTFSKKEIGYLIYFYKFSRYDKGAWEVHAPKSYKILDKYVNMNEPLTYGKGLTVMIEKETKPEIIELFLEGHVAELTRMLGTMGYPVESLDININLKK
jgi:hypothetical protein